jgi:hypothetical protein
MVFANVILRLYPLSLEYSPKRFGKVEMRSVLRKKEDEKSSLLPKFAMAHDFPGPVNLCVIKHFFLMRSDKPSRYSMILSELMDFVVVNPS